MAGVQGEVTALLLPPPLSRQQSLQPPGSPSRCQQQDAGAGLARQLSLASLAWLGGTTPVAVATPAGEAGAEPTGNKRRRTRARGGTAGKQAVLGAQAVALGSTASQSSAAAPQSSSAVALVPANVGKAASEGEARKQARMAKNRATAAASR